MINKAIFLVQEAFRTIRRHKGITSISVVIMSLSLLMLAVFLLATDNLLRLVENAQRDMKVYVYLEDNVGQDRIEMLHHEILAMSEVEGTIFVSKVSALEDFRRQLEGDADLLDALEANPLPDAFWVTPRDRHKNSDDMAYLAGNITQLRGVEEVRYGKEFMDKFSSIVNALYYVDFFVGLIVVLSAIFIISNAVRLTVISRRKAIEILRLVGATNRFITIPFIIEGAVQGGLAALVSLFLLVGVTVLVRQFVPDLVFFTLEKTLLFTAACVAIGSIGSFTALRRVLKVTR